MVSACILESYSLDDALLLRGYFLQLLQREERLGVVKYLEHFGALLRHRQALPDHDRSA